MFEKIGYIGIGMLVMVFLKYNPTISDPIAWLAGFLVFLVWPVKAYIEYRTEPIKMVRNLKSQDLEGGS